MPEYGHILPVSVTYSWVKACAQMLNLQAHILHLVTLTRSQLLEAVGLTEMRIKAATPAAAPDKILVHIDSQSSPHS